MEMIQTKQKWQIWWEKHLAKHLMCSERERCHFNKCFNFDFITFSIPIKCDGVFVKYPDIKVLPVYWSVLSLFCAGFYFGTPSYSNISLPAGDFYFVMICTGRERWGQHEPSETMGLGDVWKQLSWFYYQYLLVTALYMLEPWERTIFSILFS